MLSDEELSALVATRGGSLARFGFLLTGDAQDARDLVQEALVRVFARSRRGRDLAAIEPYVRAAMLNVFLDGRRRHARLERLWPLLPRRAQMPDHGEAVGAHVDLVRALRRLSPRQRSCVVLHYYEDMPVAAVADLLGCRPGTVKRHLSDAVAALTATLNPPASTRSAQGRP